jgi:aldehyde oxidoreductase
MITDKMPGFDTELGHKSIVCIKELAAKFSCDFEMRQRGSLWISESEEELEAAASYVKQQQADGYSMRMVDKKELHDWEPYLHPDIPGGHWSPECTSVSPYKLCFAFVEEGKKLGLDVFSYEKVNQIKLDQNDSAYCPNTGAAAGSRSHYMAGLATIHAANQLMDAMRKPDGTYRTYDEMIAENIPTKYMGKHVVASEKTHLVDDLLGVGRNVPEFNYIVMVAEVEVEVKTGKSRCVAARGVANNGVVGNYLAVEGQAYGGFQHCVGFALTEDYSTFDAKYASMAGCGAPTCNDIPDDLEFEFHVTPRPDGPFGSIGCSENFQSCGHMAVINAINNAVGVRIYELPATPNKILAGMKARAEGKELKPNTYDFGDDFYEVYDKLTEMAEELEKTASVEH